MRRTFLLTIAALITLGILAGAALAQGPGSGQGHGPPPFAAADVTILTSGDHGEPSSGSGYNDLENSVDSLTLTDGDWKVTASGAANLTAGGNAPNCGLVLEDDGDLTLLSKQNFGTGDDDGRRGFAVTGAAIDVEDEAEVHLVCYGVADVFEHNLVAIGGN